MRAGQLEARSPYVAKTGVGRGMSFAVIFRRFWAVAANKELVPGNIRLGHGGAIDRAWRMRFYR